MKITVNISYKEFMRLNLFLAYRKRGGIISMLLGLTFLLSSVLYFSGIVLIDLPVIFQLTLGVCCSLLLPLAIYRNYKNVYYSNHLLQEPIEYDLTKEKLRLSGKSFKSEADWNKIFKIAELKNYFLIYTSARSSNAIPKTAMSVSEVNDLRSFFNSLDEVKIKKMK